jgi:hypothetical protein
MCKIWNFHKKEWGGFKNEASCQFHQHFSWRFFRTKDNCATFSSYVLALSKDFGTNDELLYKKHVYKMMTKLTPGERGGGPKGVLQFNMYLRREGCWEITHIKTRGEGVSKKAPKFNTYYLNGPFGVKMFIFICF